MVVPFIPVKTKKQKNSKKETNQQHKKKTKRKRWKTTENMILAKNFNRKK